MIGQQPCAAGVLGGFLQQIGQEADGGPVERGKGLVDEGQWQSRGKRGTEPYFSLAAARQHVQGFMKVWRQRQPVDKVAQELPAEAGVVVAQCVKVPCHADGIVVFGLGVDPEHLVQIPIPLLVQLNAVDGEHTLLRRQVTCQQRQQQAFPAAVVAPDQTDPGLQGQCVGSLSQ
jgi:hypothetical protein